MDLCPKKVKNCWCQLGGAVQAAGGPLARLKRAWQSEKNRSSMLVQAQRGEAQAAEGFWVGPGKKKSKTAGASRRGAAQAAELTQTGLKQLKHYCRSHSLLRVRGNAQRSRTQGLCFCYEYLFGLFTSF